MAHAKHGNTVSQYQSIPSVNVTSTNTHVTQSCCSRRYRAQHQARPEMLAALLQLNCFRGFAGGSRPAAVIIFGVHYRVRGTLELIIFPRAYIYFTVYSAVWGAPGSIWLLNHLQLFSSNKMAAGGWVFLWAVALPGLIWFQSLPGHMAQLHMAQQHMAQLHMAPRIPWP